MNNELFKAELNKALSGQNSVIPEIEAWAFYKSTTNAWAGRDVPLEKRLDEVASAFGDGDLSRAFDNVTNSEQFQEDLQEGMNAPFDDGEAGYYNSAVRYVTQVFPDEIVFKEKSKSFENAVKKYDKKRDSIFKGSLFDRLNKPVLKSLNKFFDNFRKTLRK